MLHDTYKAICSGRPHRNLDPTQATDIAHAIPLLHCQHAVRYHWLVQFLHVVRRSASIP